jgi:uncharacterized protein YndB with AHSA1/START domain
VVDCVPYGDPSGMAGAELGYAVAGQPDEPANYHTVTYELTERAGSTLVVLSQDNNASDDDAKHSADTWQSMLAGLKEVVETS